ncbi:MAG: hypothetical protein LC104_05585 [Bacteroidales bacterium]|nr:hypothetical protein [Bacteroidales bacterium]
MTHSGYQRSKLGPCGWLIGAVLLLAISSVGLLPAQEVDERDRRVLPSGTYLFRGLLDAMGLQARYPEELNQLPAEQVLIVLFGYSHDWPDREMIQRVTRRTLAGGGALLLAGEEPAQLQACFPRPTGLSISRERVFSLNPLACFDHYPGSPYPVARPSDVAGLGELLRVLPRTATNHPAALTLTRPSHYAQTVLAGFPSHCRLGADDQTLAENQGLLVVGSSPDPQRPYRTAILSDPSILTNQMLALADPQGNGPQNLLFAHRLIQWLQAPTNRSYCVFMDYGRPRDRFYPLITPPPLPIPPLPNPLDPQLQAKLTNAANHALTNLEDQDGFNRRIIGEPGDRRRFFAFLRTVAILTAMLTLLVFLYRFWAARHKPEPRYNAPKHAAPPHTRDPIQAGRSTPPLSETARLVLRELFRDQGAPTIEEAEPLPPLAVTGQHSRTLKKNIQHLWRLLTMTHTDKDIPQKDLESMIASVWNAAQAGQWRFLPTGGEQ